MKSSEQLSLLATYAARAETSQGREFPQKKHPYRSGFDRDRDRIIHSSAFRRLEGKTQVFTPSRDDNFRTRLTHSIEVAQIGRTIAKVLRLNESLTEAICLAHDLGHSPFGHCGETALAKIMKNDGGFEHNKQTMRIVEIFEKPYPEFRGLNLLYETRIGLSRHYSPYDKPEADNFKEKNASLEGQIANVADRIAYNCHDVEDGLRSRIISHDDLSKIEIYRRAYDEIGADKIGDSYVRNNRVVKTIMNRLIGNAIKESELRIKSFSPKSLRDVMDNQKQLIDLDKGLDSELRELESFLLREMYLGKEISLATSKVEDWLSTLFERFTHKSDLMPGYYRSFIDEFGLSRAVCDYIAGMTDSYCLKILDS